MAQSMVNRKQNVSVETGRIWLQLRVMNQGNNGAGEVGTLGGPGWANMSTADS